MISGSTLRTLRQMKGIKQQFIAKKLRISQPAYCKLESCNNIKEARAKQIVMLLGYRQEEFEQILNILPAD
jgi:predicted transcriptional regulator